MNRKATLLSICAIAALATLAGCSEAQTSSWNVSQASDNFEVQRRIVFLNGITDTYLLEVEGLCSITADNEDQQLEVICKVGDNEYKKHYLGLSDNVSYFAEQIEPVDADPYHYRVQFRPEAIIPDVRLDTSGQAESTPQPTPSDTSTPAEWPTIGSRRPPAGR